MQERWTKVTVSRNDEGLVRIDPSPASAPSSHQPADAFQASIPVAGGVLTVDVRLSDAAPTALLRDVGSAQAWLRSVYGPAVASEVLKYATDPTYGARWTDFATTDYLSATVSRLGEEFWLHRWWPADWAGLVELDEDLLEVEISGVAWGAEALWDDPEPIRHLLAPHAALAAAQVRALLDGDPATVSGTGLEVFASALRAVVDLVSDEAPGYDECMALLEDERLAALAATAGAVPVAGLPWLRTMAERVKALVAASTSAFGAGWLGEVAYEGGRGREGDRDEDAEVAFTFGAVDCAQVPPRVVSMREPFANLAHRVVGDQISPVVEVVVPAAANYTGDRGDLLYARVYDRTDVPLTFPLEFQPGHDDEAGAFVGSRPLFAPTEGALRVDVYSPDFARRPRFSAEARQRADAEFLARAAWIEARANRPSAELTFTEQVMRVAEQG